MAAQQYRIKSSQLPAGACFTSPQELLDLFARHMFVEFSSSSTFFSVGSDTPASDKRTTPWLKLDSSGRPVGWFVYYSGNWRPVQSFRAGMIVDYNGNSNNFDTTGKGKVGTDMDGWALCNGSNGTPDLRDVFIVGGNTYQSGEWRSNASGSLKARGGSASTKLTIGQLPPQKDQTNGSEQPALSTLIRADSFVANDSKSKATTQDPIETLPPYFALAKVMFIGYN